jgi:hypothetical protein
LAMRRSRANETDDVRSVRLISKATAARGRRRDRAAMNRNPLTGAYQRRSNHEGYGFVHLYFAEAVSEL